MTYFYAAVGLNNDDVWMWFCNLQDYIDEGTVEYYHLPRVTPRTVPLLQLRLYYLCLKHVRWGLRWSRGSLSVVYTAPCIHL